MTFAWQIWYKDLYNSDQFGDIPDRHRDTEGLVVVDVLDGLYVSFKNSIEKTNDWFSWNYQDRLWMIQGTIINIQLDNKTVW